MTSLYDVCMYLRNWFVNEKNSYSGKVKIENGALAESYGIKPNQYFRIMGSDFNDGVYQYPITALTDEEFTGTIWRMSVPPELVSLITEMNTWETKYGGMINSPYQSESKADYSYSLKQGQSGRNFSALDQFSGRLAKWRKI